MRKPIIPAGRVEKLLLITNIVMACIYFSWWFIPGHVANPVLYGLLVFGEVYHMIMALTFWMTIWPGRSHPSLPKKKFVPTIDIFITVAGEPVNVIRETARAARDMQTYPHTVHILNDSYVAGKENWHDVELLAQGLGIKCITRKKAHGAKAGNINNGLMHTKGDIVVIFDADMVAHSDFLEKTIPYFQDKNIGFIQTPQYYKNASLNRVTRGAWEQQELFYGAIMQGKGRRQAAFILGTNVAIRRQALEQVGGMCEDNIAEDFLTSLFLHQKKWKSYYILEVLSEGLAPEDLLSYFKQQSRWARGSLEVLFGHNPFFKKGLSMSQRIQYLSSALYYFNGIIILIDILMPLIFLFTGLQAVSATTTSFAIFFIPFMVFNLYTLFLASGKSITFRAIAFSYSIWTLQLLALKSVLLREKTAFAVTPKQARAGNFLSLAYPHIAYIAIAIIAIFFGTLREGMNPSVFANAAWAVFNIILFLPFIQASCNWSTLFQKPKNPVIYVEK